MEQADRLRTAWASQLEREFGHHGDPEASMDGETLVEALMARLPIPLIGTRPEHTWIWSSTGSSVTSRRTGAALR